MIITCPTCKRTSQLETAPTGSANDDEDVVEWSAPEGFRKVVGGWRSNVLNLYCRQCGVPAQWGGPRIV
ncbi:hypothetical protein NI18_06590 [Sphingomonas sp. Ant20]|nr:hypothetical protein NI18_06590 [Sphingomonas sp. Ant20]